MTLKDRHIDSRIVACKLLDKAASQVAFVRRSVRASQIESEGVIRADLKTAGELIQQAAALLRPNPQPPGARKSKTASDPSPASHASS